MTEVRTLADIEAIERRDLADRGLPASTFDWISRGCEEGRDRKTALRFVSDARRYEDAVDVTYGDFLGAVRRAANAFHAAGVGSDDVVSLLLPNVPEAFYAFFGAEAVGIANPINPLLEADALAGILRAADTRVLVTLAPLPGTDLWQKVETLRAEVPALETVLTVDLIPYLHPLQRRVVSLWRRFQRAPSEVPGQRVADYAAAIGACRADGFDFDRTVVADDVASLFHTGGTTGTPKLAAHTHGNEVYDAWALGEVLDADPDLVSFCGLPLFHVNGMTTTGLLPFAIGGTVILGPPQGYRAPGLLGNFWRIVEHYRVQTLSAVPTVYSRLLEVPIGNADITSLRYCGCGAAPMPVEVFRRFEQATGVRLLEGYGLTEGTCVSAVSPLHGESRVGSVGLRLPYQQVLAAILDTDGNWVRAARTDEVGALLLRGPNVMPGYREGRHDEGTWVDAGDGQGRWLNTGDLGRIDADGYVWLTGRGKELIIRGGHNIDPALIEGPLAAHPEVALAAAVGRPDAQCGEMPVAYVQLRAEGRVDEAALLEYARRHVRERAAVPKAIHVVDELPLTAIGKVFKPALRHREIEAVARQVLGEVTGVTHAQVDVHADPERGDVVTVQARAASGTPPEVVRDRVAAAFGPYAFDVETTVI